MKALWDIVHNFYNNLSDSVKYLLDGLSIGAAVAAFISWLPHIAAAGSVVWIGLRIYETWLNIRIARKTLKET